ncbi:Nicotinamide/nicotinic acid mononucleotide adenylyltransferase 1 [Diaporthe australafricana]|uniref:Nicotinamide-nucleotide adenylyltransferase n=1 Tax=Diaporthe australafricana TaxID=127596 RepID=A0ABR3VWL7_9PEZI
MTAESSSQQQQQLADPPIDQMDHDLDQDAQEATTSLPNIVPDSQLSPETYRFPSERLLRRQRHPGKTPIVLVACGSFSPITYLHMRMFEMASDYARFNTKYEIVGGFLSPVSDAYKKPGLAPAKHRIQMCSYAAEKTSEWLTCDPWEAIQSKYFPTAQVLDHFDHEINQVIGGCEDVHGNKQPVRIALLAGADLIQTMSTPGVWSPADLDHILRKFGAFIIERTGTDIDEALAGLKEYKDNIHVIPQVITNDVSSTKVRLMRKRDLSLRYVVPDSVIEYIDHHGLYRE